ncbi:MAG: sugar ABC transporter permease, partial [Pseudomonadota bacterium]
MAAPASSATLAPSTDAGARSAPSRSWRMGQQRAAWLLLLPAITLMLLILILPVLIAAALSFSSYSLGSPNFEWV